jgi:hypothetical protein
MKNQKSKGKDFYWEKYRWEFMRRNPEYRKAYDELQQIVKNNTLTNYERGYAGLRYAHRWGFYPRGSGLPNPYNSFEEEFEPDEIPNYFDKSYTSTVSAEVLEISINLNEINSVHEIKTRMVEDFEKALDFMKKQDKKPKSRKRIDFDVILAVGDLREDGLTYEQIAKKIFPRDFNINNENAKPESAIRKVGQYYHKYKELVEGGYKDITFP